jgi:hypothetical protein
MTCRRCSTLFIVCGSCDHGRLYCGPLCQKSRRREANRESGKTYRRTEKGRANQRDRQGRFRGRRRQRVAPLEPTVTHQGSSTPAKEPVLQNGSFQTDEPSVKRDHDEPQPTLKAATATHPALHCFICNRECSSFVRDSLSARIPSEIRLAQRRARYAAARGPPLANAITSPDE